MPSSIPHPAELEDAWPARYRGLYAARRAEDLPQVGVSVSSCTSSGSRNGEEPSLGKLTVVFEEPRFWFWLALVEGLRVGRGREGRGGGTREEREALDVL